MKRFLLTMICAMALVAVNAQNANKIDLSKLSNVKVVKGQDMKHKAATLTVNDMNLQAAKFIKNMPAKAKRNVAPQGLDNLEGIWIEEHTEWMDELTSFNVASQIEIEIDEDEMGEGLRLKGLADGYANLYATYDAKTGELHIPSLQQCYTDEEYGPLAFCALNEYGEISFDDYILQVEQDENGHISMNSTSENGWVILVTEGAYAEKAWNVGDELIINQPNFEFTALERHIEGAALSPNYNEYDGDFVYVENFEGTAIVHGMFGSSIILSMAENGVDFTVPNGQIVTYGFSQTEMITFLTYNMNTFGDNWEIPMTKDGEYDPDLDFEAPGWIATNGAYVFAHPEPDAEGEIQWDFIYVARFRTETGGYLRNLWARIVLYPLEEEEDGISSVNNTVKANNITFNVAGQKVSKDYKGLVIRNGQKMIKK